MIARHSSEIPEYVPIWRKPRPWYSYETTNNMLPRLRPTQGCQRRITDEGTKKAHLKPQCVLVGVHCPAFPMGLTYLMTIMGPRGLPDPGNASVLYCSLSFGISARRFRTVVREYPMEFAGWWLHVSKLLSDDQTSLSNICFRKLTKGLMYVPGSRQ
jgi:hypothetical protein